MNFTPDDPSGGPVKNVSQMGRRIRGPAAKGSLGARLRVRQPRVARGASPWPWQWGGRPVPPVEHPKKKNENDQLNCSEL